MRRALAALDECVELLLGNRVDIDVEVVRVAFFDLFDLEVVRIRHLHRARSDAVRRHREARIDILFLDVGAAGLIEVVEIDLRERRGNGDSDDLIALLSDDEIRSMIDDELVFAHRSRALNPDNPFIRGTAQNPDVYFQGRETVNPFYDAVPQIVREEMDRFAALTGWKYSPVSYFGAPDPDRVANRDRRGRATARR